MEDKLQNFGRLIGESKLRHESSIWGKIHHDHKQIKLKLISIQRYFLIGIMNVYRKYKELSVQVVCNEPHTDLKLRISPNYKVTKFFKLIES